jgi:hypothetical protein
VERDALFNEVVTVEELYEKLMLSVKAFPGFIGASLSSSDEEEDNVDANTLAKLIDLQDDAGEDLLIEQLGLVKPVQITEREHVPGKCIECEDRPAVLDCVECGDEFCAVCYLALHRRGNRASN